jgi:hypothetical protein
MMQLQPKRRFLIILILLLAIAVSLFLLFFTSEKDRKLLEIKIVTNHSLCASGNTDLSPECISLLRIYEGKDIVYYPTLRVKRLDLKNEEAEIMLSRNIVSEMERNEVQEIIQNAVNDQMPSLACKAAVEGSYDFYKDTLNIRHFFLVPQGDRRIDERVYFDRIDKISMHIERMVDEGLLFSQNQKPDAVNVIVLKGSDESDEIVVPKTTQVNEKNEPAIKENTGNSSTTEDVSNTVESAEQSLQLDEITVEHNGGRNIVSWSSNYEDAEYVVTITCADGCYEDGTDYSFTTKTSNKTSVEVDLSSKWDNIKQRKFQVRVDMTREGKKTHEVKSNVKLFCK